jgi:hypothetical protein
MLRRDLVTAGHRLAAAQAAADPAPRRAEKDRAREIYLRAREEATSDMERSEAAATWAHTLDRVNRAGRLAERGVVKARAAVAGLEQAMREAERAEQAARILAEAAEAACLDARVRLAGCEERLLGASGAGHGQGAAGPLASVMPAGPAGPPSGPSGEPGQSGPTPGSRPSIGPRPGQGAAPALAPSAMPGGPPSIGDAAPVPRISAGPRPEPLVIETMVSGDRRALELAAVAIAEHGRRSPAEVRVQLQELVDAIESAASGSGYLVFDARHPFWSSLSVGEASDVMAALARLGFRFEPAEGWHAGRAPTPSDLAMALAYAGLSTRQVRRLPSAEELRALPASIGVDARAWLAAFAPDLAIDQLVRLLEERAVRLGPLWDAWGLIRPILLSPRHLLGSLPG